VHSKNDHASGIAPFGQVCKGLRRFVQGLLTAGVVMVLALWAASGIERKLLRRTGGDLSIEKLAANVVRALLLFIGLLFALSAVGIDLTALGVLGGAVGVGLGFGLQKIAANYISGFVILAERSLRIGDTVKIDGFEGRITDIRTRYTLIRARDGREAIVPNEMLITQRVENSSLADQRITAATTNGNRPALRANTRVNHRHMGADWQVHKRLDERLGTRLDVIGRDGMGEVEGARLWGDSQHHARKDPGRWVTQPKVGCEGDQSRLCMQWT
jgi:hypothetical protein